MTRQAFDPDATQASEPPQRDHLLCNARGCPMPWSVDMGNGRLCSWHDCAPDREWPRIAAELVQDIRAGRRLLHPLQRDTMPRL